mmetsp:Transcript_21974/g.77062  ORF Transcript_21974/g.77062 Transcript_21974/m.77062 type:complete len:184 (-) Transcript_21974:599-1150(-)
MGMAIARLFDAWSGTKEKRMLLLGLDAAGKTTLLYNLKLGEVVHTMPTIGFNCEAVSYKNVNFTAWDIGGQDKLRRLWRYYYEATDALVWIVDSADEERLEEAREELHKLLAAEELRDAKLLVCANKQDLPHALSPAAVADKMGLHSIRGRDWFVQGCTATRGDGLYEGLDWVVSALHKTPKA